MPSEKVVVFGHSSAGQRYLLGVHDNDKKKLREIVNSFRQKFGGDVALITTELNQLGLFKI